MSMILLSKICDARSAAGAGDHRARTLSWVLSIQPHRITPFLLCVTLSVAGGLHAATYYVDCETGNDAHEGLSETQAWQSTDKVSMFDFRDGDSVRFKRGCIWENVSIKVSRSLTFESYGIAPQLPRLIAATRIHAWSRPTVNGIVSTQASIAPGAPGLKDILIVHDERHNRFYERVHTLASLDLPGRFFHDVAHDTLYVNPFAGVDPQMDLYVSSKPHIIEFQPVNIERVVVDGLHLSFANEYAIGFWYQSSGTKNGSLKVANCTFTGNAYQAIHIGGTNIFRDVDILNNTITANGNEGIYIRYLKDAQQGEVVTGKLRISGNTIGGEGFGWRAEGGNSAANGEGIDIKQGVAAGIIDHNTIFDLNGYFGIGVGSSNIIVEYNIVRDIHMAETIAESSVAGILVDAYGNKGPTVVRGNTVTVSRAHGVVIRGDVVRRPKFEIYDNEISVAESYYPFAFTSQNITNTVIRNNRTRGGRAGLAILKPCCSPEGVEFHDNVVGDVAMPLFAVQDLSTGVRIHSNVYCLNGPMDAGQEKVFPNNTFRTDCARTMSVPEHLRIR